MRPARIEQDALWYARALLEDVADHEDDAIRDACAIVIAHGDDPEETRRARNLRALIEGETQ